MVPSISWVPGATDPDTDFTLYNIPFGIISTEARPNPHAAVAIGRFAFDFQAFSSHPRFYDIFVCLRDHPDVLFQPTLNAFAACGRDVHRNVRQSLQLLFATSKPRLESLDEALVPLDKVKMHLPMQIGDYTDFYAGIVHAEHVGTMFRGLGNALQPNYKHVPVGYHGRASSIVVSGTPIRRPKGQIIADPIKVPKQPETKPTQKLDYEVELGCFISKPNEMGTPIDIADAEEHIFGYVLLNDWSARDIQAWEYVPLGPFNGKNFATTISPWVVLHDALNDFRESPVVKNDVSIQRYLVEKTTKPMLDVSLEAHVHSKLLSSSRFCLVHMCQPPVVSASVRCGLTNRP
jgi:fumarylacetoacetase